MMKRIFTLVLLMSAVLVNAQSIKVTYLSATVNNNDTVFVPVDEEGNDVDVYFGYQNMTNSSIQFVIRKSEIVKPQDADMMFCVVNCYDGEISNVITMAPNEIVTDHSDNRLHTIYSGSSEPALVKYTFDRTDVENEDQVSFYISYISSTAVKEADMVKALRAYPNPAVRNVTIDYVAPNTNSSLVIKNLTGKEVYRASVGTTGSKQVDVSSLSAGVYFYGIESEGKMLCTKKLLIK